LSKSQIDSGCYQLICRIAKKTKIETGRLGIIEFPRGYYIYTGRALKNLQQRIARHCRADKKMRWHIDYLLTAAEIIEILIFPARTDECRINGRSYKEISEARFIDGFGSSDCRCQSHLIWTDRRPVK
jgi:sugar fermentation stimulation protein A